jgi:cytochrome d ubiquinol oxidase subunit I
METALLYDRFQFAFTITFHYLFPQLTMGLLTYTFFVYRSFRGKVTPSSLHESY